VVQFSSATYSVQEACTSVAITVTRNGDTSAAASVDYNTSDVTASERSDYITALGTLNFAPGETSESFVVLINDDSEIEGNETFQVNLSNPSGISLGALTTTSVEIIDNATEPAGNVSDDPQAFVCQHYHDFLNRQPDASGLDFWTNEITSCGNNPSCVEVKRINVSAAFFLSIEFQETGYLVYRMYKSAYGNLPSSPIPLRLNEFRADRQRIGQGVVVGIGDWRTQLDNNKNAFVLDFVNRSKFSSTYPATLTSSEFVDALYVNAGVVPSTSERDAAIAEFGGATTTVDSAARRRVLRRVAENSLFSQQEFNRAFVLMQYYGYLQRDPYAVPDTDLSGYNFWLNKLTQFKGNFVDAEMVKAFLVSAEYRRRFGP
jgi:hypothetical protein